MSTVHLRVFDLEIENLNYNNRSLLLHGKVFETCNCHAKTKKRIITVVIYRKTYLTEKSNCIGKSVVKSDDNILTSDFNNMGYNILEIYSNTSHERKYFLFKDKKQVKIDSIHIFFLNEREVKQFPLPQRNHAFQSRIIRESIQSIQLISDYKFQPKIINELYNEQKLSINHIYGLIQRYRLDQSESNRLDIKFKITHQIFLRFFLILLTPIVVLLSNINLSFLSKFSMFVYAINLKIGYLIEIYYLLYLLYINESNSTSNRFSSINHFILRKEFEKYFYNLLLCLIIETCLSILLYKIFKRFMQKQFLRLLLELTRYRNKTFKLFLNDSLGFKLNTKLNYALYSACIKISLISFAIISILRHYTINLTIIPFKLLLLMGGYGLLGLIIDLVKFMNSPFLLLFLFINLIIVPVNNVIKSLVLLFYGKKYNVLKKRIDSLEYTFDQLLLRSIFLLILVLLYPTIFCYYLIIIVPTVILVLIRNFLTNLLLHWYSIPWYYKSIKQPMSSDLYIESLANLSSEYANYYKVQITNHDPSANKNFLTHIFMLIVKIIYQTSVFIYYSIFYQKHNASAQSNVIKYLLINIKYDATELFQNSSLPEYNRLKKITIREGYFLIKKIAEPLISYFDGFSKKFRILRYLSKKIYSKKVRNSKKF